jgi:predicted nucleotidyltransferase
MAHDALLVAEKIARRFGALSDVEAVALAGSQTTGIAEPSSDVDIYVYSHSPIPAEERMSIAAEFSDQPEMNDFWGPGNEWADRETGIRIDCVFLTVSFIEDQLDRVVRRCEAELGYSTAFWHTVRVSHSLFDSRGWFERLQQQARQDYPEPLVRAIVAKNYPVLRQIHSSYRRQLEKASLRGDTVSLNHRMAAFLASYFDIVFAVNRLPHPGEKRLLDFAEQYCGHLPANLRENVNSALQAAAPTSCTDETITQMIDRLVDTLDELLAREKLLDGIKR